MNKAIVGLMVFVILAGGRFVSAAGVVEESMKNGTIGNAGRALNAQVVSCASPTQADEQTFLLKQIVMLLTQIVVILQKK